MSPESSGTIRTPAGISTSWLSVNRELGQSAAQKVLESIRWHSITSTLPQAPDTKAFGRDHSTGLFFKMNSSSKDYSKLIEVATKYVAHGEEVEGPWAALSAEQQAAHDQIVEELVRVAKETDVRVFQFRDSIYVISSKDGVHSVRLKDLLRLVK